MDKNTLKYQIGITLIPKIGAINAKKLIAYAGSPEAVFKLNKQALLKIPGIGESITNSILSQKVLDRAEKELEFIDKYKIATYYYLDDNYPKRLKQCDDAPIVLFARGNIDFNQAKVISIVGTRKATEAGKSLCDKLVKELAERGHQAVIVSGLAYGIDITAHKAALKYQLPTIAVVAHGLDMIYPSLHTNIAKQIVNQGAIVSELLSGNKLDSRYFVQRNRIIAGLADATVVVESQRKGGALITAEIANSYNRDVFAFPGRIDDRYSAGCNRLIKIHKAALIESVEDLEYVMSWDSNNEKALQQSLFTELTEQEEKIVDFLKTEGEQSIDVISFKAGLSVSQVSVALLSLEFNGFIKSLPGKIYRLTRH